MANYFVISNQNNKHYYSDISYTKDWQKDANLIASNATGVFIRKLLLCMNNGNRKLNKLLNPENWSSNFLPFKQFPA